jgi:hypothetical protein
LFKRIHNASFGAAPIPNNARHNANSLSYSNRGLDEVIASFTSLIPIVNPKPTILKALVEETMI